MNFLDQLYFIIKFVFTDFIIFNHQHPLFRSYHLDFSSEKRIIIINFNHDEVDCSKIKLISIFVRPREGIWIFYRLDQGFDAIKLEHAMLK